MKTFLISCIVCCMFFISCSSDDSPSGDSQPIESNFYGLKVGNTWTYEYFRRIGNTEEFETSNAFDEVKIVGSFEIDGETYYSVETITTGNNNAPTCVPPNGAAITKVRDSLGYLINDSGAILFSHEDEGEYLVATGQQPFNLYGILISGMENIEVTSGTFSSKRNEVYGKFEDGTTSPGRNFIFYTEGIGEIKQTYNYATNPLNFAEKRLVSYEISD